MPTKTTSKTQKAKQRSAKVKTSVAEPAQTIAELRQELRPATTESNLCGTEQAPLKLVPEAPLLSVWVRFVSRVVLTMEFRRYVEKRAWHFCRNCPDWPRGFNVIAAQEIKAGSEVCPSCEKLREQGKCQLFVSKIDSHGQT
jgi:hypothetical protein